MRDNQGHKKSILTISIINAASNVALAIIKIIIGIIGSSQALIADGLHSFADIITDAFVYFAARASVQHPDHEHPYGHRRIETIGAVIIALILISVGVSIVYEGLHHLLHRIVEKPTYPVVIVAIISIVLNEWLFRYSKRMGEKINSALIVSNAWHKRSDVFVSVIVLLSVIGAMMGWHFLDSVGAIIIAAIILKMGVQIIWQSMQELIDHGVDEATLSQFRKIILGVAGVRSIHQLRTRLHAGVIFVDVHIIVDPFISVSEGHHIGESVHLALMQGVSNVNDVTVHIDSENDEVIHPSTHLPDREHVKSILKNYCENLPGFHEIKKITLHYFNGKIRIEIDMPKKMLGACHADDLAQQYLAAVRSVEIIESIGIRFS